MSGGTPRDPGRGSQPRAVHPATLAAGDRFGRYEIRRRIAAGGMGVVYQAEDTELGRPVALKLLLGVDDRATRRFVAEARGQARVEHPAVCRVYEAGEIDEQRFIAMQYVAGPTLGALRDRLSTEQKVRLLRQVCAGVDAAHQRGLIHRDLKPTNVLVAETDDGDWQPLITDFGLVKDLAGAAEGLTETGIPLGSPAYMAPEQARGEAELFGERTDVYGLGATLYDLLCGDPPFVGDTPMEIILQVVQADAPPLRARRPQIPPDLDAVVMRCLERDPRRRYPSARALAEDLGRFLDGRPVRARPTGWWYRTARVARRHRVLVAAIAATVVVVAVLGGLALRTRQAAARQSELAQQLGQEVKDIEWSMRAAHLAPPHDLTAEKEAVQDQMARLEARLDPRREDEAGLVSYALGRGALALGDAAAAEQHLQRAWDGGYRTSEVAYGLGIALATRYQQERRTLAALEHPAVRAARAAEIERRYRAPALEYLEIVEGSDEVHRGYVEALLAYHGGDTEGALERLATLPAEAPWFYESGLLTGQVQLARAADLRHAGEYGPALERLATADEALVGAAEVGRSDPRVQLARCEVAALEAQIRNQDGTSRPGVYERGVEACTLATTLDPAGVDAWVRTGALHRYRAFVVMSRGEDPLPTLGEAMAATGRALELDPEHVDALVEYGVELRLRGEVELKRGRDPSASIEEAIATFERALERDPGAAQTYSELAGSYYYLAMYRRRHGGDVLPALQQAITAIERAAELNPEVDQYHSNLGNLLGLRAELQVADPAAARATVEEAIAAIDRALALNPSAAANHVKRGIQLRRMADLAARQGEDPVPLLEEAIAAHRRAIELKPDQYWAHNNAAIAHAAIAEARAARGEDPTEALDAARALLDRAVEIDPTNAYAHNNRIDLMAMAARLAWERGEDPRPLLREGYAAADRTLQVRPGYPMALANRALLATVEARDALSRGQPAGAILDRGRRDIDAALAVAPDSGGYLLVRARLELLAAEGARGEAADGALDAAEDAAREAVAQGAEPDGSAVLAEVHLRRGRRLLDRDPAGADEVLRRGLEVLEARADDGAPRPVALAVEGHLWQARAQAAGDPAQAADHRARGDRMLADALREDPSLARQWGAGD